MELNDKIEIRDFPYSRVGALSISQSSFSKNWPYVYLIHDKQNIYIGETQNILNRTKQHLDSGDVSVETNAKIHTIYGSSFNKSAILDIENTLIQGFVAENKYNVLNRNSGQSSQHDYYQKSYYHNELTERIWDELIKLKLVNKPLYLLKNLDIFKYSPYVSLTSEQLEVCTDILTHMYSTLLNSTGTYVVHGSAGTGKTVLSIYLLSILRDCVLNNTDSSDREDYDNDLSNFNIAKELLAMTFKDKSIKNIGFVVPMTSLRNTLKKVFNKVGLKNVKVIGPDDSVTGNFDILFVDEAHRLYHRKNLTGYGQFDKKCKLLGLEPARSNQLQWIMLKSKYCVLFYDEKQSIKKSDITPLEFKEALAMHSTFKTSTLTSQLRCEGGADYIQYIDDIFECRRPSKLTPKFYEFKMFNNIENMVTSIKEKNQQMGLCLLIAGYGWEWKSKDLSYDEAILKGVYDIEIDNTKLIWNTQSSNWIYSDHAKDEVGCVHTTQGYDLNYAGVIIGPEIDYDAVTNKIKIYSNKFFDKKVKASCTIDELKRFIINSYCVMLKRGIKGTYIYCVNQNLKKYLEKYIEYKDK